MLPKTSLMQSMLSVSLSLQSHWDELCAEPTLQFASISRDLVEAQPSATHGLGLVACTEIKQGTVVSFYPIHALGDTANSLAPDDGAAYFDAATTRPYRVQPSHAVLTSMGLDDLWLDCNPELPHVPGWLGHLVNDAAVCEERTTEAVVAYYERCLESANVHMIPFGDESAPIMCWAATRDIPVGEELLGLYGHEYWLSRGGAAVPARTDAIAAAAQPWKAALASGQAHVAQAYEMEAASLAWLFENSRKALAEGQGATVVDAKPPSRQHRRAAERAGAKRKVDATAEARSGGGFGTAKTKTTTERRGKKSKRR